MSRVTYTNTPDRVDQEQIRATHHVRLVQANEEGTGVNALPRGVYGYTYSPGLPNAPLFAVRRYRSYETHKLADGEVLVIGYADVTTAAQIETASSDLSVVVYPQAGQDSSVLVQIPYSRIRQNRQHAAPNQDGFLVTLAPAAN
ncbi:MAG: hypothetical protein HOP16_01890 [Acidobacteria bacterium]|nr:hypothetical protein [Acidobacteriota bacterium]